MSCSTISEPASSLWPRMSPRRLRANTVLPAPRNTVLAIGRRLQLGAFSCPTPRRGDGGGTSAPAPDNAPSPAQVGSTAPGGSMSSAGGLASVHRFGRRFWRRFRRRSPLVQTATVAVVLAVIGGGVYAVAAGPAPSTRSAGGTAPGTGAPGPGDIVTPSDRAIPTSGPSSVTTASTSSRGVTTSSINVVFPVVSLNSLAGQEGFAQDAEFGEQTKAIKLFVKHINATGGINGRRINPIIVNFDPTNEASMRALCKDWTEGSPPVFAVLDGLGDWTGDNELCITQEGHTPFIGAWTTATNWTDMGSPYLWWTGPDQAAILQAVVDWGLGAGLIGRGHQGGDHRRQPSLGPGRARRLPPSRPAPGRHHAGGEEHRRPS